MILLMPKLRVRRIRPYRGLVLIPKRFRIWKNMLTLKCRVVIRKPLTISRKYPNCFIILVFYLNRVMTMAVATMLITLKGTRNFQPKSMSWSYRKRG